MRKFLSLFICFIFTLNLISANDSSNVTIDTFFEVPLGLNYAETHKILIKLGYKYDMQVSENPNTTTHGYLADSAGKSLYMLMHDTETTKVILFRDILEMKSFTPERFQEWYDMFLDSLSIKLGKADAKDEQLKMMSDKYLIKDYHNGVVDRMTYWGNTEYGSLSVSASQLDQVIIITKALKD